MKKTLRQIRNTLLIIGKNPAKAILTSIGIIVATVLYVIFMIVANSFIEQNKNYYKTMNYNEIVSESEISEYCEEILINRYKNNNDVNILFYKNGKQDLTGFKTYGKSLKVNVIGVQNNYTELPFVRLDKSNSLIQTKITSGRAINESDNIGKKRVCNIYESHALLLFNDINCLGNRITLNGLEYVVVGLLEDTEDLLWLNQKNLKSDKNPPFTFYIPKALSSDDDKNYCVMEYNAEEVYNECKILHDLTAANFYCKTDILNQIEETHDEMKMYIFLLMIMIVFFSGIIIMVTMIFNVKEKYHEIGIRRALGASKSEIMFSILFEALIYCGLGLFFGVVLGIVLSSLLISILSNYFGMLVLSITLECIILPCAFIPVFIMKFSLIPAWIGASTNVVLTLKVE